MRTGVARAWGAALLLLVGCATTTADAPPSRTVLVLYSEQSLVPGAAAFTQSLRQSLGVSTRPVEIEGQHVGLSRFQGEMDEEALAEWLRTRYRTRRLPVVVTLGVPASVFATRYGATIWPEAKIIHAAVDGDQAGAALIRGDTVIPRVFDYRATVEQALGLFPGTRQVWLIGGATDNDRRWLADAIANLVPLSRQGLRVIPVARLRWDELLEKVRHMPDDTAAVAVSFFADASGRSFVPVDALAEVARTARRPVFVTQARLVGLGAIGGKVVDIEQIGRLTGRAVLDQLNGHAVSTPAAVQRAATTRWTFDARQLRRWNVPESSLPAGSLVLNRDVPIWRRYLWPILATLMLVLVQGTIIGALLVQRRQRRRVEGALRRSEEKARASYHEVRDLAGRLITAREAERSRIARDLHDDIGQRVASLSIALSRIHRQIADTASPARRSLAALERDATQLSADLRHLSHELHPSVLEHVGLLEALRERCDEFSEESGVPVQLDVSEGWRDVPVATALCLYRVAQEALRNVAAHARARRVTVSLDRLDGRLTMQVADDGCGFDPAMPSRRSGLGLVSLGERVRVLGGALDVTAAPERGTRIAVTLPAGEPHAA